MARVLQHGGYAKPSSEEQRVLQSRWSAMLKRCEPTRKEYVKRYSERGIKVCEEWKDFSVFECWALDNGFSPELYLDRDKNSLGYCPQNCRWVTPRMSATNRDTTHKVRCAETGEIFLSTALASEWLGLNRCAVSIAIKRGAPCGGFHWELI